MHSYLDCVVNFGLVVCARILRCSEFVVHHMVIKVVVPSRVVHGLATRQAQPIRLEKQPAWTTFVKKN